MAAALVSERTEIADSAARTTEAARGRGPLFALVAIVMLAAMVRTQHLADVSCTYDEGFSKKMLTFGVAEMWHRITLDNSHPPFYYYLLLAWSRLAGTSPHALRMMSVLFGLLTVVAGYVFVRDIAGSRGRAARHTGAALIAASLLALYPQQIEWSQQARMYTLGTALTLLSSWLLLRAVHRGKSTWRAWAYYVVAAVLLLYTHYYGLFLVAAQFAYGLAATARVARQEAVNPSITSRLLPVLAAFYAVWLLWLPWATVFLNHRANVAALFWSKPLTWNQVSRVCHYVLTGGVVEPVLASPTMRCLATLCFSGSAAALLIFGRGGIRLAGLSILATLALSVCVSLLIRNIIATRYFVFSQSLWLCGLAAAAGAISSRSWRVVSLMGLLAIAAWLSMRHVDRRIAYSQRPGFIAAMAYLAEHRSASGPILTTNPMIQIVALAHTDMREQIYVLADSRSFPFFQGTAVMREEEYLSFAELAGLPADGVWTIDAVKWTGGTREVVLPRHWKLIEEEVLPECPGPGSEVVVRRYVRRDARSPSTTL